MKQPISKFNSIGLTYMGYIISISLFCLTIVATNCNLLRTLGWRTYRNDNSRSGVTTEHVSPPLSLRWTFKPTHPPKPAWSPPAEEMERTHFDNAYHVTVAKGLVYFGSSVDNKVYALNGKTGEVEWTFFTEGPVRYVPTIWKNRIYVGSDDGYVYCLRAKNGKLVWKYRAGPSEEKVLGNGRMISLWPVRTSVLVDKGVVYFGAGVFPYEGLYICALNADDGSIVWKNDTIGDQEHELAFGGISLQSYLVASKNILYVPSGRALPAAFDRRTGEFLYYMEPGGPWPSPKQGGTWALLVEDELITGVDRLGNPAKVAYDSETGKRKGDVYAYFPGIEMIVAADMSYIVTLDGLIALDRGDYSDAENEINEKIAEKKKLNAMLSNLRRRRFRAEDAALRQPNKQRDDILQQLSALTEEEERLKTSICKWKYSNRNLNTLILAGDSVIAGGEGKVLAVDAQSGKELWEADVSGKVCGLAATHGDLFVSTDNGNIYCFGEEKVNEAREVKSSLTSEPYKQDKLSTIYESAAEAIVKETGKKKGYCLVLGAGMGRLAFELAKRTDLQIVGIEKDQSQVEIAKDKLDEAGLYGSRIVVEKWELLTLPDYFATLIVSEEMLLSGQIKGSPEEMFRVLKPCGGVAYFGQPSEASNVVKQVDLQNLLGWLRTSGAPKPEVLKENSVWAKVTRGELPGAGSWTQQYGNPQNTACSEDELVYGSLGVLWFGEPGPQKVMERHARAASPVSMNGRLFVQGGEIILAYDAYNGTLLWERQIPGAVRPYADIDCGNLSLAKDGLYVAAYDKCYRLEPATGETLRVYKLPPSSDGSPRRWGYVSCVGSILYGSAATPMKEEYAALWKTLVEDGKWKSIDEIPPQYKIEYENYKEKYPVPDHRLLEDFKRSGTLYRNMAVWPRGDKHAVKGALSGNMLTCDKIFAMDARTGILLWIHNGIRIAQITVAIGDGKIFFTESSVTEAQKRRALKYKQELLRKGLYKKWDEANVGDEDLDVRIVVCLDAKTGRMLWRKPLDLTGCCGDRMGALYHKGVLVFAGNLGNHDAWRFKAGYLRYRRIVALSAKNGDVLWSRPLNYRTRPLIVGDKIIIEPRACNYRTGEIMMRSHPITGQQVPWEFLRPGHTCAVTSASANALFYRSHATAFYDLAEDRGVTIFGAIRPGCLINMIPANGVLLFPEASSGCTCSFPLRTSVVLSPKHRRPKPWTVFITHGSMSPAQHFAINLGAPSDMRADEGTLWLGYPNPITRSWHNHFPDYGMKFDLKDEIVQGMGYFCRDFRGTAIAGSDKPWLFTSGCVGLRRCEVPLINDVWREGSGMYTVRLGFSAPSSDRIGQRVFDIMLQGDPALRDFDILKEAGAPNKALVKEFNGIKIENVLTVEFAPKASNPTIGEEPLINFIEAIREDTAEISQRPKPVRFGRPRNAETILKTADSELHRKNYEEALELYHTVLDIASSLNQKRRALDGMAAIGSPKSLSKIEPYCRELTPILWEYEPPDRELVNGATKVYIAIANNIAKSDEQKAIKMLNHALLFTNLEMRHRVISSIEQQFGFEVGAEPRKHGFITRYHLLGSFPGYKLNLNFLDEPNVNLSSSYTVEDRVLKWHEYVSELWKVDLAKQLDPHAYVTAYAYTEIVLPEEQDLLLKIGCNNGFRCWFNGEVAGSVDYEDTKWEVDQDVLKVKGRKGVNKILLRIYQHRNEWEFSMRLTDMNNKPVHWTWN